MPTKNKPSVCITASLAIWIGNPTDHPMNVEGGAELCGFGTGVYEKKVVSH